MDPAKDSTHSSDQEDDVRAEDRCILREEPFPKLVTPAIIVLMGLPQAGRETVCSGVAEWAKSSVYDVEAALDILSRDKGYADADKIPPDEEAARLQRVSFDLICQMAEYTLHLYYGSKCVVLSSTFFSKLLLNRLVDMTSPQGVSPYRLLIIECQRKNKFLLQELFEWEMSCKQDNSVRQDNSVHDKWFQPKWYDPKSWKDVEKTILDKGGEGGWDEYFLTLARSHHHVKKLVVDPDDDLFNDQSSIMVEGYSHYISLFAKAIKHLLTCPTNEYRGDHSSVLVYDAWRRQQLEEGRSGASRVTANHYCCRSGDCIFRFTDNFEQEANCDICEEKDVNPNDGAYYCQFCSLTFHQACAYTNIVHTGIPYSQVTKTYPKSVQIDTLKGMGHNACYSCIDKGKKFSEKCSSCIFRAFIKSQLLPIIFKHDGGDDHILSLRILKGNADFTYKCKACGNIGTMNMPCYRCNICASDYHLECLHLPLQTKSQHGRHLHSMKMEFTCPEEDEYEWCNFCYKDINPETWVYICQECDYVAHLNCVFTRHI